PRSNGTWARLPANGRVLEVGVGSGLNFPYYEQATELVGIDPDAHLLKKAGRRARKCSFPVHLEAGDAENLPFPDASFDTVVATLVFCSVPDAVRGLREMRRVLKPGGRLRLLEHVRSEKPRTARFQDFITPAWRRISGGCHMNRDTVARVREAGFTLDEMNRYNAMVVMAGHSAA
ncbi:MAG: class I SAM-dependent methyltransferase, partial [Myxococcota bacterium]